MFKVFAKVSSKFMQEKQYPYFRYTLFFRFALINDQANVSVFKYSR